MEFSFDRTRSEPQASPKQADRAQQPVEQTHDDGIDTSTIANERLRKAIERNRAKQAARAGSNPPPVQPQSQPEPQTQQQHYAQPEFVEPAPAQEQASLFSREQQHQQQHHYQQPAPEPIAESSVPPQRPRAQLRTTPRSSAVVTRKSVATPDETEFTPVKRSSRKVATQVSYATGTRKKTKSVDPSLVGYFVKGCWIFCAVMVLRLIFANGGVTDFYSRKSLHTDRLNELDQIKKENMQLVREIERMQSDAAFQKKLVRDNLGFIAADEFLVLFPKEK